MWWCSAKDLKLWLYLGQEPIIYVIAYLRSVIVSRKDFFLSSHLCFRTSSITRNAINPKYWDWDHDTWICFMVSNPSLELLGLGNECLALVFSVCDRIRFVVFPYCDIYSHKQNNISLFMRLFVSIRKHKKSKTRFGTTKQT